MRPVAVAWGRRSGRGRGRGCGGVQVTREVIGGSYKKSWEPHDSGVNSRL